MLGHTFIFLAISDYLPTCVGMCVCVMNGLGSGHVGGLLLLSRKRLKQCLVCHHYIIKHNRPSPFFLYMLKKISCFIFTNS